MRVLAVFTGESKRKFYEERYESRVVFIFCSVKEEHKLGSEVSKVFHESSFQ